MTIVYSTFAMEQGLTKPFFGFWFLFFFGCTFTPLSAYQFYAGQYSLAMINLMRCAVIWAVFSCINLLKSIRLARLALVIGYFMMGLSCFASVIVVDKLVDGHIVWDHSDYCSLYFDYSKLDLCGRTLYAYMVWQGMFHFLLAPCTLWRQEWVWRGFMSGTSVQTILNAVFSSMLGNATILDYLGAFLVPLLLIGSEFFKFYGTLQAIQMGQKSNSKLSCIWKVIQSTKVAGPESEKNYGDTLRDLASKVDEACKANPMVIDRSKDMGKWQTPVLVAVEPPKIRQPISDFDELYRSAIVFNDTFQKWIESFFDRRSNPSHFVHRWSPSPRRSQPQHRSITPPSGCLAAAQPSQQHAAETLKFQGEAVRGPVKRPHRSIAKVLGFAARLGL